MLKVKGMICALVGVLGGAVAKLLGGWTSDMKTLLIFMGIDIATGVLVAGVFKKSNKTKTGALDSDAGKKGLYKKGMTLLVLAVAHGLDVVLGKDYIRTSAIFCFLANEALSIVENAGLMGLPLPKVITKAIEVLKESSEGDVEHEDDKI